MASLTRVAPISLFLREDVTWLTANAPQPDREGLSSPAVQICEILQERGAMFTADLLAATQMLPSQLDDVLGELVTRGWITNTFQVAFWSFFLRLAVRVWLTLAPMSGSTGAGMADDYIGVLTVNVTFLILILGTPLLTARLLSGENIAAFGEAAMGAVQTVVIARKMGVATSISKEISGYRKAKFDGKGKQPYFQHPIPSTMSRTYEAMFGRKKPSTPDGAKPAATAAAPRGKGA